MRARFRAVFVFLALACGLAALFPEFALLPFQELVSNMRAPDTAVPIARRLFVTWALLFAAIVVALPRLCAFGLHLVDGMAQLPPRSFWLLVCTLALLPRALVATLISYEPISDALTYHRLAIGLASGQGLSAGGEPSAHYPPGYPLLLALTYRLFGPDYGWAWLWGALSTAILVGAVYFVANRLHGPRVARLATCLGAAYPTLVLMTGQVMSDLPFLAGYMLLIAFVVAGVPYRTATAIGLGVGIGLLALTRGVAIGLVAVVPLIWFLHHRDMKAFCKSCVVIVIAFAACIAPWMARNKAVFGLATLSTNFGYALYVGNSPNATGGAFLTGPPDLDGRSGANKVETERELIRQAIGYVTSNPGATIANLPAKLVRLYCSEIGAASAMFQGRQPSPPWIKYSLYGVSQLVYALLLVVFFARALELFATAHRPHGVQWTGWLLTGYFTLLALVFIGTDRYRLPILPWILIEASALLARTGLGPGAPGRRARASRA